MPFASAIVVENVALCRAVSREVDKPRAFELLPEFPDQVANFGEDESCHPQFNGRLRAGKSEQKLAGDDPAGCPAEHRAAADFLEAEVSKERAEGGEGLFEALVDHIDRTVAPADSGAAGGDDRVHVVALKESIEQRVERWRFVTNDLI